MKVNSGKQNKAVIKLQGVTNNLKIKKNNPLQINDSQGVCPS